ncbi:MAG: GGDEF domain-containing protein [Hyphomicrobiales bacterium]
MIVKRLLLHIALGAALGYIVLHPASAIIYDSTARDIIPYSTSIITAFNLSHAGMAAYFSIIGALFGLLIGLYLQRTAVLYEKVKNLSVTDELTGLYNRRFFMQSLTREIRRVERYGNDLALLMLDIDNFKKYNDAFGHLAGDRLLRRFSDRLRQQVRNTDVVTRYGGEEFAVLMPDTDISMAAHLAERIRTDFQDRPVAVHGAQSAGKITVSIGCAQLAEKAGSKADDLIRMADDRLYHAKNNGRNQICYFRHERGVHDAF